MKKYIYIIFLSLLSVVTSCNVNEDQVPEAPPIRFRGVMESPAFPSETRAYADESYRIYWNSGDHVSIFSKKTFNREYAFDGDTGETAGGFYRTGPDPEFFTEVDIESGYNYSILPYQERNSCDYDGTLKVPIPATQAYSETTNGIGANLFMVARASDGDFAFKHAVGYIGIKLYGEGVSVASIKIKSNNNEPLSGKPLVVFTDDGTPYMTFPSNADNADNITLVCNSPIELGASATDFKTFWFSLPPSVLTKGFSYTVTGTNGGTFSHSVNSSVVIERKVFKTVKAREVILDGGSDTPEDVPVTGVQLSPTSTSLVVGESINLTATVLPSDATDKSVTWASTNPSVATVSNNGKVTAVAAGEASIFVITTDGGKTASCTITVTSSSSSIAVESVLLDKTQLNLNIGEESILTATVSPDNATNKSVTWTSTNPSVATVDNNGKVSAVAVGDAIIIVVTADGGKTATCTVTVTNPAVPVQSVSLDKTTLDLNIGENATLVATVLPENADNKTVTWSSSNTAVATVDATGKVTAVAAGEAVITVTTADGNKTATCTVKVNDKEANHPGDPIGEGEEEQF